MGIFTVGHVPGDWAYCDCLYRTINIIPLCFLFYRPLYRFSFYLRQTRSFGTMSHLMLGIGGGSLLLPLNMSTVYTRPVCRMCGAGWQFNLSIGLHTRIFSRDVDFRLYSLCSESTHVTGTLLCTYRGWHMVECFDGHWDEDKFVALC